MRLDGRAIIVTGAARGIGKAYAMALAKEGASIVAADILADAASATAEEIKKSGGKAVAVSCDISKESEANRLAEECVKKFGRIDVLVNNAALFADLKKHPFYEIEVEEWDKVLAINLRGTWLCTKAVFPYMRQQGKGKIINIASGTFFVGVTGFAHYVASKGAVIGLTRALSRELGQYNITINALAPGQTISDAKPGATEEPRYLSGLSRSRSLQRDEYPSDLVGTMIFLCGPDSDFMTGQTLLVDGGSSLH